MPEHYYLSLQYSAIQKTILRHERLWSIAGISNILARMNEIALPRIAVEHGGQAIVAGGGKFTARFADESQAEAARQACMALIAATLPMLEFQVSRVHRAEKFQALKDDDGRRNRVIAELGEQKRRYRGYGVSFNPHLALCAECGEYPVQDRLHRGGESTPVCRICKAAFDESRGIYNEAKEPTTLQKVYHAYLRAVPGARDKEPAADFKNLFPEAGDNDKTKTDGERQRMAVWFSDLNNMNDRVPVWLNQEDEGKVLKTFGRFRDTVVEIVAQALAETFPKPAGKHLPFRLVVAGGDDLCLAMADKDILAFCANLSRRLNETQRGLPDSHPLSDAWLRKNGDFKGLRPKPFGFGASFVVTSIHTPFSQIHRVGEELMGAAKRHTGREGNSVNWRIMAEEESVTEKLLAFERPVFIEKSDQGKNGLASLTFNHYLELLATYHKRISGSHRQQIIALMQREKDPWEVERRLRLLDSGEADKSFTPLLKDSAFRNADGMLLLGRIATLFELMAISGGERHA